MQNLADNKAIKIPEAHYVGFQKRSSDTVPLGFMTPDGTDKAAQKRKATVDTWAKGHSYYADKEQVLPSKTFENKPLTGFRIGRTVIHGGWGATHSKWRIEDPRGFELEITSGNLSQIIDCTTIENGEILEKCIWGRLGAENVLVPINSDAYKTATENTKRIKSSASIKDLKIGHHITLKNGTEALYYGRWYVVTNQHLAKVSTASPNGGVSEKLANSTLEDITKKYNSQTYHVYLITNEKPDGDGVRRELVITNSLSLSYIGGREDISEDEALDFINKYRQEFSCYRHEDYYSNSTSYRGSLNSEHNLIVLGFQKVPFDGANMKVDLVKIGNYQELKEHHRNSGKSQWYKHEACLANDPNGNWYFVPESKGYQNEDTLPCYVVEDINKIHTDRRIHLVPNPNYSGSSGYRFFNRSVDLNPYSCVNVNITDPGFVFYRPQLTITLDNGTTLTVDNISSWETFA